LRPKAKADAVWTWKLNVTVKGTKEARQYPAATANGDVLVESDGDDGDCSNCSVQMMMLYKQ